jgi:hypothetical protein
MNKKLLFQPPPGFSLIPQLLGNYPSTSQHHILNLIKRKSSSIEDIIGCSNDLRSRDDKFASNWFKEITNEKTSLDILTK